MKKKNIRITQKLLNIDVDSPNINEEPTSATFNNIETNEHEDDQVTIIHKGLDLGWKKTSKTAVHGKIKPIKLPQKSKNLIKALDDNLTIDKHKKDDKEMLVSCISKCSLNMHVDTMRNLFMSDQEDLLNVSLEFEEQLDREKRSSMNDFTLKKFDLDCKRSMASFTHSPNDLDVTKPLPSEDGDFMESSIDSHKRHNFYPT
jgi:hypothetical protein